VSFLNDVHELDFSTLEWTDRTAQIGGAPPAPRYDHGFAAAAGRLFVFGGLDEQSAVACLRDCACA
jgi:hypothetical protein